MSNGGHKKLYDRVREQHLELPPWEDLTEDQRERIRAANDEHVPFLIDIGAEIRRWPR